MNEHQSTEVYISLDFKKHRIRIYKQTISQLGNPNYVHLLIDPNRMQIGLIGSSVRTHDAHKVNLEKLGPDNSYELYSKHLIDNIHGIYPDVDPRYSYRLVGQMIRGRSLAVFGLNTMQRYELI